MDSNGSDRLIAGHINFFFSLLAQLNQGSLILGRFNDSRLRLVAVIYGTLLKTALRTLIYTR